MVIHTCRFCYAGLAFFSFRLADDIAAAATGSELGMLAPSSTLRFLTALVLSWGLLLLGVLALEDVALALGVCLEVWSLSEEDERWACERKDKKEEEEEEEKGEDDDDDKNGV
jgi:hypothetical protein